MLAASLAYQLRAEGLDRELMGMSVGGGAIMTLFERR
jgi:hypothetical protein